MLFALSKMDNKTADMLMTGTSFFNGAQGIKRKLPKTVVMRFARRKSQERPVTRRRTRDFDQHFSRRTGHCPRF